MSKKKKNKKLTDDYLKNWIVSSPDLYSKNLLKELEKYSKVTEEKPEALTRKVLIEKVSHVNQAMWEFTNEELNKSMYNNIFESTFLMLYASKFMNPPPDITDIKEE